LRWGQGNALIQHVLCSSNHRTRVDKRHNQYKEKNSAMIKTPLMLAEADPTATWINMGPHSQYTSEKVGVAA